MEIIPSVHLIPNPPVNTYLVIEDQRTTLIDTGLPRTHRTIFKYLSRIHREPEGIRNVIITHADDDHYGGLAAVKNQSGAQVYASAIEAEAIQKGQISRPLKLKGLVKFLFQLVHPLFRAKAVEVDHILREGEILPILGGLRVIATPGHTPGHISLYAPHHRLLFAGDSLRASQRGLIPSSGINTWNEEKALESVRKLASLGAEIVCCGHGPVIFEAENKFPLT